MQEQLITVETKQLMQQKDCNLVYCKCGGFPECICGDDLKLIPQSLLQKWLREVHNIDITIITNYKDKQPIKTKTYRVGIIYIENNLIECFFIRPIDTKFSFIEFDTYELALEAGLIESLKLIKNVNKSN